MLNYEHCANCFICISFNSYDILHLNIKDEENIFHICEIKILIASLQICCKDWINVYTNIYT